MLNLIDTTSRKVLLPQRITEITDNKEKAIQEVLHYLKRYPTYELVRIEDGYAFCVDKKGGE